MLYESENYSELNQVAKALSDNDSVFRFCTFESASLDGGDFGETFLACEFRSLDFYCTLFNSTLFSRCKFEGCTFRGSSFSSCTFLECKFSDCRFLNDNLDAKCSSSDTKLYACIQNNCEGWHELFKNQLR